MKALRCFLDQTYQESQLLILNESNEPTPLPLSGRPERIRYERISQQGMTTGAKRNLINSMVDSELIVNWDDDDWSHPERIARQVAHLDETSQQMVGYHDLLYLRLPDRTLWCYYFQGRKPYAMGTSMMYRRTWWAAHPFPNDKSIGEDTAAWITAASAGVLASKGLDGMIVARSHPGNTFKIQFGHQPFVGATRDMFPKEFLAEEGL